MQEFDRRFRDRQDAGRALGDEVRARGFRRPFVLALPRGGVPVGAEVARALGAPLDVVVARKIGMPGQPEYAIGAVAEGTDGAVLHHRPEDVQLSRERVTRAIDDAICEVRRRVERYRGGRSLPDLAERTAVLVDDGLATGATAEAAIAAARGLHAQEVVVAVPVGAGDTVERLSELATVVCLSTPERFTAVGIWYDDFAQTTDAEVLALLGR